MLKSPVVAVNFHLIKACNLDCRFCFATFRDVRGKLPFEAARNLLDRLWEAGTEKLNFAGGEPTLHPQLGPLIKHAKSLGMVTSIVTNGFHLEPLAEEYGRCLDWVGLSVDSGIEAVQAELGRGKGDHVRQSTELASLCRDARIRIKLNTVVTSLTWQEDMSTLVRAINPERWKVFQVLPLVGQNDGRVEDLLITTGQFQTFVERHNHLIQEGFAPVVEDNDAMRGSYVMIDPLGRFFGNSTGRHVYSDPILEVGVAEALSQVGFSFAKFVDRGGEYRW